MTDRHMMCLAVMGKYRELLTSRRKRKEYVYYMMGERISDGSPVSWTSGLGMYTVTFSREETDLWVINGFKYIITMTVKDNIGIKVYETTFTECDTVNLMISILCDIDTLIEFGCQNLSFIGNSNSPSLERMIIGIVPNQAVIDNYDEIEWKESVLYSCKYEQLRDLCIEIRVFNALTEQIQTAVIIPACFNEVYEFVDTILGIINDIELPMDFEDEMEYIMSELRE